MGGLPACLACCPSGRRCLPGGACQARGAWLPWQLLESRLPWLRAGSSG